MLVKAVDPSVKDTIHVEEQELQTAPVKHREHFVEEDLLPTKYDNYLDP